MRCWAVHRIRRFQVALVDRGQSALELVGIVMISALVVGAVYAAVHHAEVRQATGCAVDTLLGQGDGCSVTAAGQASDDGDRRDQEGQTRDNRRDDARGDRGGDGDQDEPTEGGTSGGAADPDGLGEGTSGTTPPPMPGPPAWSPPDAGSGPWASEGAGINDRATVFAAEAAANALAGRWPDAARNLLHFLGNTGDPLTQDVNSMLSSSKSFRDATDQQRRRVIASAVEQAEASGATGPMTFPVNTPWRGVFLDDDDNWYYALNGISYNQTGYVTVVPPSSPGGDWTYTWSTQVNIRDRYNWDGTKSTQIGPFTVTDEQLAELHRKGLAREFTAVGASGDQGYTGEVTW